ncbi:DUF3365 domain-containing protein [Rhodobacteraceae bacterium NNCM2]|nr:DUF3365 domain-containing protein [Coraliihabitans acroporae]
MLGSRFLAGVLVLSICMGAAVLPRAHAEGDADKIALANKLANMLRAGRTVVSTNQELINNPEIGDKEFTGEKLVAEAEVIFADRTGEPLISDTSTDGEKALLEAQKRAMQRIVDEHQTDINKPGVGFKGFIPAVFARLVNEEFKTLVGEDARVRATAPSHLVRNRKARPDPWEKEILETRFVAEDWPEGEPYTERMEYEGRPAFRMIFPEYYNESCLSCHGGPKGELDVTGYPKEGGEAGDLAGAISIVIFE